MAADKPEKLINLALLKSKAFAKVGEEFLDVLEEILDMQKLYSDK